jgi:uncharacterized protein with GYD domain
MPEYVLLMNWTDRAVTQLGVPEPGEVVAEGASQQPTDIVPLLTDTLEERLGLGKVERIYWTLGGYDLVVAVSADSDEVVAGLALYLGSLGLVRTTTLRAFNQRDMSLGEGREAGGEGAEPETVWDIFSRCH